MINTRTLIFADFETGSLNGSTTQPLELAALAIDPRKLEVIKDSLFHAKIRPLTDEQAAAKGLDPVQKTALAVNHLTLEELKDCPSEEEVWNSFVDYTYQWNPKKTAWDAPIFCGFNNSGYDIKIVNRLCEWYGPWDKKRGQQKIFNPIQMIDLKDITWLLNENNPETDNNSFDTIRKWLSLSSENAHTSVVDVQQGCDVLCRCMKLIRYWSARTSFV